MVFRFPINLLFVVISTTACVSGPRDWPSVHGVVLDKDTNEPVEGAFIITNWGGAVPRLVQRESVCYRIDIGTSDKQGKFTVPFWLEGINTVAEEERHIRIYKSGMTPETWPNYPQGLRSYYMQKDSRSRLDRLNFILAMYVNHSGCNSDDSDDDLEFMLIQMYREVYSESVGLAGTDAEKEVLKQIRYWIASDWNETTNTLTFEEADKLFEENIIGLPEND
jgi:hypothetical protein